MPFVPAHVTPPSSEEESPVKWYCIRTRPRQELVTARMLRTTVGIEIFCPMIRFQRARARSKMWVTEALFPCYLFGHFDYADHLRHVHATSGVVKILSFGGQPAIVPDEVIAAVRESVSSEEVVTIEEQIQPGDEVKIIAGPYAGLRTVVTKVLPARQRVGILLEILGSEREVEVSTDSILSGVERPMIQK